jgi:hypothetical protein
MSDVRVPIEKEYDNPKRRPGGTNFNDLLARSDCPPANNPFSLMSSFIDEAFDNGTLDDNELAGMKVLAGLAPAGQTVAPQAEGGAQGQHAPPDKAACESQTSAKPVSCSATDNKSINFNSEVAKTLDKSKDWDSGEQLAADTAQRLINASSEQQLAFLERLCKSIADNDIDEANEGEGSELVAFVDGLFARAPSNTGSNPPRSNERQEGDSSVIRDFLCKAMSDNRLTDNELAALRALVQIPTSEHRRPSSDAGQTRPGPVDPATTLDGKYGAYMDRLVASGGISYDTAERAKATLRQRG